MNPPTADQLRVPGTAIHHLCRQGDGYPMVSLDGVCIAAWSRQREFQTAIMAILGNEHHITSRGNPPESSWNAHHFFPMMSKKSKDLSRSSKNLPFFPQLSPRNHPVFADHSGLQGPRDAATSCLEGCLMTGKNIDCPLRASFILDHLKTFMLHSPQFWMIDFPSFSDPSWFIIRYIYIHTYTYIYIYHETSWDLVNHCHWCSSDQLTALIRFKDWFTSGSSGESFLECKVAHAVITNGRLRIFWIYIYI